MRRGTAVDEAPVLPESRSGGYVRLHRPGTAHDQSAQPVSSIASSVDTPAFARAPTARARAARSAMPDGRPYSRLTGRSSTRDSSSAMTAPSGCIVIVHRRRAPSRAAVPSVSPPGPSGDGTPKQRQYRIFDVPAKLDQRLRRIGAQPLRFEVSPRRSGIRIAVPIVRRGLW